MSYNHVSVTLTPGQIKKLQSGHTASTGASVTLKHSQLAGGPNKIPLTKTQLYHLNKAKASSKGVKIDFSAAEIKDMVKSGGIFPLIPILAATLAPAAIAAAKAAGLGAAGAAAGWGAKAVLDKVSGKGYKGRRTACGGNLGTAISEALSLAGVGTKLRDAVRNKVLLPVLWEAGRRMQATGRGYKKEDPV